MLSIDATPGAGRLMALATLGLLIEGVSLTLRGVRLVRTVGADVIVEMPQIRDHKGRAAPIVDLPPELRHAVELAVRREVLETVAERSAGVAR